MGKAAMQVRLQRRRVLVGIMVTAATAGTARAQDSRWLVGTWQGSIIGLSGNNARTLRVRSVAPDGAVAASWAGEEVQAAFRNGELSLTTGAGNPVTLTRSTDGKLEGFFTTNRGQGRRYSVVLEKRS